MKKGHAQPDGWKDSREKIDEAKMLCESGNI